MRIIGLVPSLINDDMNKDLKLQKYQIKKY